MRTGASSSETVATPKPAVQQAPASRNVLPEAIADLQQRINSGEVKLDFAEQRGYLSSLLKVLKIPVSSQSLVFGKNSAQLFLISPETPRALYFNSDVYVGYVQGAPHLEIASGALCSSLQGGRNDHCCRSKKGW